MNNYFVHNEHVDNTLHFFYIKNFTFDSICTGAQDIG